MIEAISLTASCFLIQLSCHGEHSNDYSYYTKNPRGCQYKNQEKKTAVFDTVRHRSTQIFYIICYNIYEVMNMKEAYLKSLQMIKTLNIKNEKEYNKILKDYLILNVESLKYISQTRKFKKIIKLAEEV